MEEPAGQRVQMVLARPVEKVPALQETQGKPPDAELNVPAAHAVQLALPW